jgi:hypothetical protein
MSDRITIDGLTFLVAVERDDIMGEPWTEHDGHGIISDWTSRSKAPGERVLASDRSQYRYYDVEATMEVALRDHWGCKHPEGKSKRQIAAEAVDQDYEYLRAWCNDEWYWVVVTVILLDTEGRKTHVRDSLGGIESSDEKYIEETAREMAEELARSLAGKNEVCVSVR